MGFLRIGFSCAGVFMIRQWEQRKTQQIFEVAGLNFPQKSRNYFFRFSLFSYSKSLLICENVFYFPFSLKQGKVKIFETLRNSLMISN